jgi:hypothetical protein
MKKQILWILTVCTVFILTAFTPVKKSEPASNTSKTKAITLKKLTLKKVNYTWSESSKAIFKNCTFSAEATDLKMYDVLVSYNTSTGQVTNSPIITQTEYPYDFVNGAPANSGTATISSGGFGLDFASYVMSFPSFVSTDTFYITYSGYVDFN